MFNWISDIEVVGQNLRRIVERGSGARREAARQAIDAFERGVWEPELFEQAICGIHPATFDVLVINGELRLVYIDNFSRIDEATAVAQVLLQYGTLLEQIAEAPLQATG